MSIYTASSAYHDNARCPSCAQAMQTLTVDSRSVGPIEIDVCVQCSVIWFDNAESAQLAPSAVVELFKIVNSASDKPRLPLANAMPCPRCNARLALTHDICKAGRISYYRCQVHGRLTPFYHFLKEKQFIRQLTPMEIGRLRADARQIQCSGCGGAIHLEKDTACSYCGAAIAVLDADAVGKAMEVWATAAERRRNSSPEEVAEAAFRLATAQSKLSDKQDGAMPHALFGTTANADLLSTCITTLGSLFVLLDD